MNKPGTIAVPPDSADMPSVPATQITDLDLTGSIIAHRNDRMGGRLIAMINAMRIADVLDLPFRVGWTTHGRTSPEIKTPEDIFADRFIADHFFGGDDLARIWADLRNLATVTEPSADAVKTAAAKGASYLSEIAIGRLVLPWEEEEAVKAALPAYFKRITFSDAVAAAMANIDAGFQGLSLRAYHIRRGDIISDPITSEKLWPNKYIPREFYEIHIRDFLADGGDRCIVFSDTQAEIDRLKAIDDRIVSFDEIVPQGSLKPGQRDILELYSMSKCPMIFGPPESAFSQTAATIGGGTVFAVQESLPEASQAKAMDLMSDRMAKPAQYFLGDGDLGQNFPFLITHHTDNGQPQVARDIIQGLVDDGFTRSYAFSQLCRLSLECDGLRGIAQVRDAAHSRPLVTEAAMADVHAYSALAAYQAGDTPAARHHIHAAFWLSPLDPVVHGTLNLMLSAGWIDPVGMYPIDADLVRNKAKLFPPRNPLLDVFNQFGLPKGQSGKLQFYPWDLAVRDWRFIHGKKLNRAFWHKGKMANEMGRLIKSSSKIAGSPQLHSAVSVYQRFMEDFDGALGEAVAAVAQAPDNALYAKRRADVLLERGDLDAGLKATEAAAEMSGHNPYYLAHLGVWYGRAQQQDAAYRTFLKLADLPLEAVELQLLTSEFLRRRPKTRDRAMDLIEGALAQAHGAHRVLLAKAKQLITLGRIEEADAIYRALARQKMAHDNTFVQMYRMLTKIGHEDRAISITAESQFDPAEIKAKLAATG